MPVNQFLYARPRLWCRLFGHSFRHRFTERLYTGPFKVRPSVVVHYRECRCCPTREAVMHGPMRTDVLNYDWLREKFDAHAKK